MSPSRHERVLSASERLVKRVVKLVDQLRDRKQLDREEVIDRLERLVAFAERTGLGDRQRAPKRELIWEYRRKLQLVQSWRGYLALGDIKTKSDVADFLRLNSDAKEFAAECNLDWTVYECQQLVDSKPSDWTIDALALKYGVSRSTIKNRLHRKRRRHSP